MHAIQIQIAFAYHQNLAALPAKSSLDCHINILPDLHGVNQKQDVAKKLLSKPIHALEH